MTSCPARLCPTPEIYPGSILYRDVIHGQLPAGLSVRPPTPCPWPIRSTVDLNKFHLDVPKTRSTDVRVNGDTLNLWECRLQYFDIWQERCHPWLGWMLQKMRRTRSRSTVGWSKGATNYDGEFSFASGLELGGNGVGFETIGDANPRIGQDPFVWHMFRVVRRPGVVYGTIYWRLDGSKRVQLRSGITSSHIQSEGMKIALRQKQGTSAGEIEFRRRFQADRGTKF